MLRQIRSFLTVVEEENLHRAAERLRMSQSAISRQMLAIEAEVGGRLLDRSATGVRATAGGRAFAARMKALVAEYDEAVVEARRLAHGQCGEKETRHGAFRIGCIMSAAPRYLRPALRTLRKEYPDMKIRVLDLSSGQQIEALRRNAIELAIVDHGAELLARDFYVRTIATVRSIVILPADHPLATRKSLRLAELKDESFLRATDEDVPGYNNRITSACRKLAGFRPRMIAQPQSLSEGLSIVTNENAVMLLPDFVRHRTTISVRTIPLADDLLWDLTAAWHINPLPPPMKTLLDALCVSKT